MGSVPTVERGVPEGMYSMEMVEDHPTEARVRRIFTDIERTLSLTSINSDYRTLALWPDYLEAAWKRLKPRVGTAGYQAAAGALRDRSLAMARELPRRVVLSPGAIEALGEDMQKVRETTERFERLLPGLIVNIALLALDWEPAERLAVSPFPARSSAGDSHALA